MSKRADAIIDLIDAGLQTPMPDPSFGELSPKVSERCARCDRADPAESSDFCTPCRDYLLGDGPDPSVSPASSHFPHTVALSNPIDVDFGPITELMLQVQQALIEWARIASDAMSNWLQGTVLDKHLSFALDPGTILGAYLPWYILIEMVQRQLWIEYAYIPRYAELWCEPGGPCNSTIIMVRWSSLDYLLFS